MLVTLYHALSPAQEAERALALEEEQSRLQAELAEEQVLERQIALETQQHRMESDSWWQAQAAEELRKKQARKGEAGGGWVIRP